MGGSVRMLSNRPVRYDPASGKTLFVSVGLEPEQAAQMLDAMRAIYPARPGSSVLSAAGFIATVLQTVLDLDDGSHLTRADIENAVTNAIEASRAAVGHKVPQIREEAALP